MRTIVIYDSGTGFTQKYANRIAEALNCDCKSIKVIKQGELAGYDKVIFGGWIMGSDIMGLEKLRGMAKPEAVFAVGVSEPSDENTNTIKTQNKLGDTPFFYMQGGLNYDKLGFIQKLMLKMVKNSLMKKPDRTPKEEEMAKVLGTSFDNSSKEQIAPLIDFLNK